VSPYIPLSFCFVLFLYFKNKKNILWLEATYKQIASGLAYHHDLMTPELYRWRNREDADN
jgi:hypothetical protein